MKYLPWMSIGVLLCAVAACAATNPYFLDADGVFVAAGSSLNRDVPLPAPNQPQDEIAENRGQVKPVRCRLVDYIDCTAADTHAFVDDGGSRVLDLPGGKYRVTAVPNGFELKWFRYTFDTSSKAGTPHLMVLESPNDQERYTTASITAAEDGTWLPPFEGAEKTKLDGFPLYQAPFWYDRDVGLNVYTGRELPTDNKPFRWQFVFYPKCDQMWVTISSSGWARNPDDNTGGAVSRIWVFEVLDELADHAPKIDAPASGRRPRQATERHIGLYVTHPFHFIAHYGIPPFNKAQRRQSFENMFDLMQFCGLNMLQYNAINGSDRAGRAWYPGSHYTQCGTYGGDNPGDERFPELPVDLLSELPPVAKQRGIDLVPVVTSLTIPGLNKLGTQPNEYGFSLDSVQKPADPGTRPLVFNQYVPDPLRPETQRWLVQQLTDIARRSKRYPNVPGIGFRVNGKIGTCYTSGEDKSSGKPEVVSASEMGYSKWHLFEFRKDTGLEVPLESLEAYDWLKADPKRWDAWLDWRCRRTRAFWLRARDAIRKIRPDFTLYVLTDLPSEVPGTNIEWPGPGEPDALKVSRDLLRGHGYDPELFKNDRGIVIQRVMMAELERLFSKWGPPWGANPERYRDFHEQDELARWYRTPAGSAVEIYHSYWEEAYHPQGEFGFIPGKGGLRTATATAVGRAFFRPMTATLRAANNDTIVLTGWQRGLLGHEHDLRTFAQAFRALPVTEAVRLETSPVDDKIQAAWYGDRIGVINDTPDPVTVTVKLDRPLPRGAELYDVISDRACIDDATNDRGRFTIELAGYDFRSFAVRK